MASRRLMNRIYYFTVEDEGILGEAFPKFEQQSFCLAYKVIGTDDVFVASAETTAPEWLWPKAANSVLP